MTDLEIIENLIANPLFYTTVGVSSKEIYIYHNTNIGKPEIDVLNSFKRNWYYVPSEMFIHIVR